MGENRVLLITGASGGLGEAVAGWLGSVGATVVLLARRADALDRVASRLQGMGAVAHVCCADVSNPTECQTCVAEIIERFGRLDGVVNNAGILDPLTTVADADLKQWRHNLEVNLFGPLCLIRESIPQLRDLGGRVVNVSSGAAHHPIYAASAYCASKAGLNQMTSVLAKEEPRITFVSVRPGVVDTAMQDYLCGLESDVRFAALDKIRAARSTEAMPTPADLAGKLTDTILALPESVSSGSFADIREMDFQINRMTT